MKKYYKLILILCYSSLSEGSFVKFLKENAPAEIKEQVQHIADDHAGTIIINVSDQVNNNRQETSLSLVGCDLLKFERYAKWWIDSKNYTTNYLYSWCRSIKRNKIKTCCFSIVASYLATQATLIFLRQKLNQPHWWSLWMHEKSLEDLQTVQAQEIRKKLLLSIQRTYINPKNPMDFTYALSNFIKAVNKEKKYLQLYQAINNWIDKLYLRKFFVTHSILREKIPQRLNRLAYTKNIFVDWLSQYNTEQALQILTNSKNTRKVLPIKSYTARNLTDILASITPY